MMAIKKNFYSLGALLVLLFGCYVFANGLNARGKGVPQKHKTALTATPVAAVINSNALRDSLVAYGSQFLGTPYRAGGCSQTGFDCSGLVYYVFQHFNIPVPRSSAQFASFGTQIPIDSVKAGDILVFLSPTRNAIGHVGIVTNAKGAASDFIHASSGREMKVIVTSLTHAGYTKRFVKAVNVVDKK